MNLKRDGVRLSDVFTTFPSPLSNWSISDGKLPSSSSQLIDILLVFLTGHLTRWYSEIKLGWAMESKRKRDRKRESVRVSDNLTSFPHPLFNQLISDCFFPPLFNWSMSGWLFEWPAGGVVKWGESVVSNVEPVKEVSKEVWCGGHERRRVPDSCSLTTFPPRLLDGAIDPRSCLW